MTKDEQSSSAAGAPAGEPYGEIDALRRAQRLAGDVEWAAKFGSADTRDRADAAYGRLVERQGYDPLGGDHE
jgi:hypothetical protein